jgi:alpha-glucosidase
MHLYLNRPKCHEYLRELGQRVLSKYDVMTVGETPHVDETDMALQYVHPSREEFCMIFPWEHMDIDRIPGTMLGWREFSLTTLKGIVNKWQTAMQVHGGWNSLYLENHDQGRSISRFGNDSSEFRWLSGKLLSMFLASLSGTLYVFQGQEIGMINLPRQWGIQEYSDVVSEMHYRQEKEKKGKMATEQNMEDVMDDIQKKARDHGRTPMQWTGALPHGGFTTSVPWRKVNPDYTVCNVGSAETDSNSILAFWKQMLQLRKQWKTLVYGDFELLHPQHEQLFAYKRTLDGACDALVLLNFSTKEVKLDSLLLSTTHQAQPVLGNYENVASDGALRPWEARLYRMGYAV